MNQKRSAATVKAESDFADTIRAAVVFATERNGVSYDHVLEVMKAEETRIITAELDEWSKALAVRGSASVAAARAASANLKDIARRRRADAVAR